MHQPNLGRVLLICRVRLLVQTPTVCDRLSGDVIGSEWNRLYNRERSSRLVPLGDGGPMEKH